MKKFDTKALTEASLTAALSAVLMLIALYVPGLALPFMLVAGVPVCMLTVKHGLKISLTCALALLLVLCIATGEPINILVFFMMMILPAVVSGICIKHDRGFLKSLLLVILTVTAAFMANVQIINITYGDNFVLDFITEYANTYSEVLKQGMNKIMSIEGGSDVLGNVDPEVLTKQTATSIINTFTLYFPSIVIISSTVIGFITFKINAFFVKRMKIKEYRYNVPFKYICVPKSLVYIMILLDFVIMFSDLNTGSLVISALANMELILTFAVIMCGFAFIEYYFSRAIEKGWIRVLIYVVAFVFLSAFMSILVYVLELLGIIDTFFGIRRYMYNSGIKS